MREEKILHFINYESNHDGLSLSPSASAATKICMAVSQQISNRPVWANVVSTCSSTIPLQDYVI